MGCVCGKESVTIQNRKYYVRSRLGEGGFSVIDLVEDQHSRRLYALKRITCHSKDDEKNALHEVELMNSLHHHNLVPCEGHVVVPVSGHKTAISELLIVMPFYKKGSIYDELVLLRRRSQHMTEDRILYLMTGLCEAIMVLHTATPPLAHRDIKPHNVMLDVGDTGVDDIPVLMDFGSMGAARIDIKGMAEARALQDYAAEHCSMPYRAPELFNVDSNCQIDERVDIWSLGCTLYAMCFYESPFDAVYQRGDSVALAVMSGNICLPDHQTTVYSTALLQLIQSMLTVDPLARPTIMTVQKQLKQMLTASPDSNRV
jgi:serine/threonine kinase 16